MENLQLVSFKKKKNSFNSANIISEFDSECTYYYNNNNTLSKLDFTTEFHEKLFNSLPTDAIAFKILKIENKLCLVRPNTIEIYELNQPSEEQEPQNIEFNSTIAAISWNPNEEAFVIVFDNRQVGLYSIDYINYTCNCLGTSSLNATVHNQAVNIEWGSERTQFRGSEGKWSSSSAGKDCSESQTGCDEELLEKVTISWRGNGEMFVINFNRSGQRRFVVFDESCRAIAQGEYSGMIGAIAWRPSGNSITTAVNLEMNAKVLMFEKNGLISKEYNLPSYYGKITDLKWSPCSQYLAVVTENGSIIIITFSNDTYYIKQSLDFPSNNSLKSFEFINSNQFSCTLTIITEEFYLQYIFKRIISLSKTSSLCAVIDGRKLYLTSFDKGIIPPPQKQSLYEFDRPINFVIFPEDKSDVFAVVDSRNYLIILTTFIDGSEIMFNEISNFQLEVNEVFTPLESNHFIWLDEKLCYLFDDYEDKKFLSLIDTNTNTCEKYEFYENSTIKGLIKLSKEFEDIPEFDYDELNLRKVYEDFYIIYEKIAPNSLLYLTTKSINNELYFFYLTTRNNFYINNIKISSSINSYLIIDNYLLLTSKENHLYCLRLTNLICLLLKSKNEICNLEKNYYYRNIEQGSQIVCFIENESKIVLQMPRGNLETISCRLISIDKLEDLLINDKWFEALDFMRLESLDYNLIIDLNSERFLNNIQKFVDATRTNSILTQICSKLSNLNVLETTYKNCYTTTKLIKLDNKLEQVFNKMFDYFHSIDYSTYLEAIIVIKIKFYSIQEALNFIQNLLKRSMIEKAKKALKILKDHGYKDLVLYDEALGLYDLDLAKLIVDFYQMDPKYYYKELDNYRENSSDPVTLRFQINLALNRFKLAIRYVIISSKFTTEEVLGFIKKFNVYTDAYKCCERNSKHFIEISKLFADYLCRKCKYSEAMVVLKRANLSIDFDKIEIDAKNWKFTINSIQELELDDLKRNRLYKKVVTALIVDRNFKDAATVFEYYLNDYLNAIKVLNDNYLFNDAIFIANKYNCQDVLENDIIPAILKYYKFLIELVQNQKTLFNKYKSRLFTVREKKIQNHLKIGDDSYENDNNISDVASIISQASTTQSSRSRFSSISSKNRRKEERKKVDLKEGGVYEDIALVRALHIQINEIYNLNEEIMMICYLLLEKTDLTFSKIEEFFHDYSELIDDIKKNLHKIWPSYFYFKNPTEVPEELALIDNIEHLDIEYRTPPSREAPQFKSEIFK